MADIAIVAVIRKVADILGNLLVDEGTRWYWLRNDIRWIEGEMRLIQSFLRDAEDEQGNNQRAAELISGIRDLGFDVEDIIDTFVPKLASHNKKRFLGCLRAKVSCKPNFFTSSRHKFGMEIERIKKWVEDINRKRTTYNITEKSEKGEEQDSRQSFPHVEKQDNLVGLESHIKLLKDKLLGGDPAYCVISIVGMAGLGKTTLAREVFNSVKKHFECCAWVYISREPRVRDVLQDIGRQVGLAKKKREESLEANLYGFLQEKRYVIVLDDIWKTEAWDVLKKAIPCNSDRHSRLILTSRDTRVGLHIGGDKSLHTMEPLDSDNSWELFSSKVMLSPHHRNRSFYSPELETKGRQILEKCGGIPLAIVVVGSQLLSRERTVPAWKRFLQAMGQGRPEISKILALSYRDLSIELRQCFLYFGLFPEDSEIPATKLINLWVAEGFVQVQGAQMPEDAGEDNLHELISRNLIQVVERRIDGRVRTCRIHDLLHNLCTSEARKNHFFITHDSIDPAFPRRARRVTIYHNSICNYISLDRYTPSLRTLLGFNNNEEKLEKKHFEYINNGLRLLRVLSLEGVAFPPILPDEIGDLVHLSYLELGGDDPVSLPSTIGNLKNLKTLDGRKCKDLTLPTVIWKMKELRHILLTPTAIFEDKSKCVCTTNRSQPIEDVSLPNLQTLHRLNGNFVQPNRLRKFTNLRKLGLICDTTQVTVILSCEMPISNKLEKMTLSVLPTKQEKQTKDYILNASTCKLGQSPLLDLPACPAQSFSAYQSLSSLYLEGGFKNLPEFPSSLTKLTLLQIQLEEDPMEALGKLGNLKRLYLGSFSYMGLKMIISGPGSFPSLENLIIESLPLKELKVDGEVMPKLRYVKINFELRLEIHSDRLKRIFSEFNDYLMNISFLEMETDSVWLDDDICIWEEEDLALEPSRDENKGKELMPEVDAEQDIIEDPKGISGIQFELGLCSTSGGQGNRDSKREWILMK